MEKFQAYLSDWVIDCIKNRDIFIKNIIDIKKEIEGFDFIVNFKDKKQYFIVKPFIDDINGVISRFGKDGYFSLIVFNTKENLNTIINNWDRLIKFKNLSIYFVNPLSGLDKKWIIL